MTKIERLQAEVNQLVAAEEKETARLKAVNAQLLEALERIADFSVDMGSVETATAAIKAATEDER